MKSTQFNDDQGERSDTFLSALQVVECHKGMSMCVYICCDVCETFHRSLKF